MIHLAISCLSYLLFFLVKILAPTQPASWRVAEQRKSHPSMLRGEAR